MAAPVDVCVAEAPGKLTVDNAVGDNVMPPELFSKLSEVPGWTPLLAELDAVEFPSVEDWRLWVVAWPVELLLVVALN